MVKQIWHLLRRAESLYWHGKSQLYYRALFGALGKRTRIIKPLKVVHPEHIFIGERVSVAAWGWLAVYPIKPSDAPKLTIGDRTEIGNFSHITCVERVEIGRSVLIADRVHISDNEHAFEAIDKPIIEQGVRLRKPVSIGDGTWIGENVNVLACKIGRNCVIGANAVVIADIPDFSVAVGIPAKVIKRYDLKKSAWVRCEG